MPEAGTYRPASGRHKSTHIYTGTGFCTLCGLNVSIMRAHDHQAWQRACKACAAAEALSKPEASQ